MQWLTASSMRRLIPRRAADSHKGDFGHVLVVAGSRDMTGAAYLAALGALRAGAGLVTVACAPEARAVIRNRLPEAMTIGFSQIFSYVKKRRISTLAIGPGLGVGRSQKNLIKKLLALCLPTVLDADGLNNLALSDLHRHSQLVMTPHEGELAHLTGKTRMTVHRQRERLSQDTARMVGGVCLLKGHRTVISDSKAVHINTTGTPAMATGGMGDVLTGVIAGLLAQGLRPLDAACLGAWAHGRAGQKAAASDRGLLAHEVADTIPVVMRR